MATIKAKSNIDHNSTSYKKDDVLEVSEEESKALVEAGAAEYTEDEAPENTGDDGFEEEELTLPDEFETDAGKFSTKRNKNGNVYQYLLNGEKIKKAEYEQAYKDSLEDSEEEE